MSTEYSFTPTTPTKNTTVIFKKWHKRGVCSVSYWHSADDDNLVQKVIIDIAEVNDGKVASQTKCYVPLYPFMAYLRAEVNGTLEIIVPNYNKVNDKGQMEGWASYGGSSAHDGTKISRVFKSVFWGNKDKWDTGARAFKCAQFQGIQADPKSPIMPDYSKPITMNFIRLTLADMAEMLESLQTTVIAEKTADAVGVMEDA